MRNLFVRFFKNFDWYLVASTIFLFAIGLSVLYSTTYDFTSTSEAVKQTTFLGIGLVLMFVMSKIDYRFLRSYTGIFYLLIIFLLIFVKFIGGKTALGAVRWIDLGFFQFQPSLLSQLLMAIILAKYFSEHYEEMHQLKTIIKSAIYVGIPTVLVAIQPDLGTALVFLFTWGIMLLASNAKRIYIFAAGALGVTSLPFMWLLLKDYQKARVMTFINPAADPTGSGWNVTQAMIAIGSGQFWGRGLGKGTQSQLNFIPEKHTDFIFASMAEEMGFLGVVIVLLLFVLFFFRSLRIAVLARDFFGTYLAVGIAAILFFHVFINIGMNMGIMPVTGIPLPFLTYGGTPVLVDLLAVGVLESIYARYKKIDF